MSNKIRFEALLGLALSLAAASVAGCAAQDGSTDPITARPNVNGQAELIGGEPVASDYFRSTVGIGNVCSAAKVGARLFLTAAHCVSLGRPIHGHPVPEGYPPNEGVQDKYLAGQRMQLNWGLDANDGSQGEVTIVKTSIHPSWWACPACQEPIVSDGAADIAVIEIAEDTPAIPQARVELGTIPTGTQVIKVGWGCEERTNIDATTLKLGRYKAAQAQVIPVSEIRRYDGRMTDEQVARIDSSYLVTGGHDLDAQNASLCLGDSGGPLYLPNKNDPRVVGVNSDYTFKPILEETDLGGVSWTDWHTRTSTGSLQGVGEWLITFGVNTVRTP